MGKGTNVRNTTFWIADALKGGRIRFHYKDVKGILQQYSETQSVQKREQYLDRLLDHARESTPFYKNVKGKGISDFPVINKITIRNNYENFKSGDPRYKHAATVRTSGSTGTPFAVELDTRKKQRNSADTIFFGKLAGYTLGMKLYYFKIWNEINRKNPVVAFVQNIVPYDVRKLGEKEVGRTIETLQRDRSGKALLAYASVFDVFCSYLINNGIEKVDCNLKSVIAMSEQLSPSTKERIREYTGMDAISRYSNVENGIIAQQLPEGNGEFLINEASYYLEILEFDSDKPAKEGSAGRIVITDLFNYRMPMIRYDTGDIGILETRKILGEDRLVFTSIEGRRMDLLYDTSGSLVSSYVITNNMWKYLEIKQYQFIQTAEKEYLFRLNTDAPFDREQELLTEFSGYFGKDCSISIEYVKEIPLLDSGKRRKVMNTWKNP
ncbi:MAG: CoF synthetase [Bacteroidota bacterium]|nr:CoF synthetase [Bacteroidota bacterium]